MDCICPGLKIQKVQKNIQWTIHFFPTQAPNSPGSQFPSPEATSVCLLLFFSCVGGDNELKMMCCDNVVCLILTGHSPEQWWDKGKVNTCSFENEKSSKVYLNKCHPHIWEERTETTPHPLSPPQGRIMTLPREFHLLALKCRDKWVTEGLNSDCLEPGQESLWKTTHGRCQRIATRKAILSLTPPSWRHLEVWGWGKSVLRLLAKMLKHISCSVVSDSVWHHRL